MEGSRRASAARAAMYLDASPQAGSGAAAQAPAPRADTSSRRIGARASGTHSGCFPPA
jgi:hypothetical protein